MSIINRFFVEKLGADYNINTFIGKKGDIFYDAESTTLRISDGVTPGGTAITGGAGSNTALSDPTKVAKTGDTMTGPLVLPGDPTTALQAAPKQYVDIVASTKAPLVHTHVIADVTNLQTSLDSKAPLVHTHAIADVTGLQTVLDDKANATHIHDDRYYTETEINTFLADKANVVHTHVIADTTGLQTALDAKANTVHSHVIADTTGLQAALDAKANVVHTHTIADVTNLQTTLDGKANVVHTHVIADTTGLQTALDDKANIVHTHAISELSDATITSPVNNQVLTWNGTKWVNASVPSQTQSVALVNLTDVQNASAATNGQVLSYNSTASKWEPVTLSAASGGVDTVAELLDVDVATIAPTEKHILAWDDTQNKWRTAYTPKVVWVEPPAPVTDFRGTQTAITSPAPYTLGWADRLYAKDDLSLIIRVPETGGAGGGKPWYSLDKGATWTQSSSTFGQEYYYNGFRLGNKWSFTGVNQFGTGYTTTDGAVYTYFSVPNGIDGEYPVYTYNFADMALVFQGSSYKITNEATLPNWSSWKSVPAGMVSVSGGAEATGLNYGILVQADGKIHKVTGYETFELNYGQGPAGMTGVIWNTITQKFYGVLPNTLPGAGVIQIYSSPDGVAWTKNLEISVPYQAFFRSINQSHDGSLYIMFGNIGYVVVNGADDTQYAMSETFGYNPFVMSKTENIYIQNSSTGLIRGDLKPFSQLGQPPVYPGYVIDDLDNVSITAKANGEYLRWDASANAWVNGPGTYLYDHMSFDPATNILGIGFIEESGPTLTADLSALAGGGSSPSIISVNTLPTTDLVHGQIVEFNGLFYRWTSPPDTWVQVG